MVHVNRYFYICIYEISLFYFIFHKFFPTLQTDDKSRNISNKVDLLGLDDSVPNNADDTFGDFVFASQQPPPTNQTLNGCGITNVAVSSAVDDLMGLNLGNNGNVPPAYAPGINATPNLSVSTQSVPNVGGKLDKSSILALYNNSNTGGVMGQMTNSSGWPSGAGSSYQSGVLQQGSNGDWSRESIG